MLTLQPRMLVGMSAVATARAIPWRRWRSTSALVGSRGALTRRRWSRARRCPSCPQDGTSRDEEVGYRAFYADCRGPVERFGAAGDVPNRSRARVALCAVVASGLKPPAAVFNRLRP